MQYRDAEDNVWEFRYIVTQTEDEGPERMEFRPHDPRNLDNDANPWRIWGESLPILNEAYNHFHGFLISDDVNPDGIMTLEDAFAIIRAFADNTGDDDLRNIGYMDEPLIALIRGALDGSLTPANRSLLAELAGSTLTLEVEPDDEFEYNIEIIGRLKGVNEAVLVMDSVKLYAEGPLHFAEHVERAIMECVQSPGGHWTRHELFAWINNPATDDNWLMSWTQASDLLILEQASARGYDVTEHFQTIQDAMAVEGLRFARDVDVRR
jgi:hypothetical protein